MFCFSNREGGEGALDSPHLLKVTFWEFRKRENSTLVPDMEAAIITVDAVLKSPEGKNSLALDCANVGRSCNYCYIEKINRYYFISEVEYFNNSVTRYHLEIDVLASFRGVILDREAYILRAASDYNSDITDTYYPATCGTTQKKNSAQFIPLANPSFIVSAIGNEEGEIQNTSGAARYYLVSETALAQIMQWIFNESNYETAITDQVVKTFFNPSQYLIKCMYCPFASSSGGSTTMRIGWWDTGIKCTELSPQVPISIDDVTLSIPFPHDGNDYRDFSPYASYSLYIPYVGMIDLAADQLKGSTSITISGKVDICTGEMMLKIMTNTGRVITYASATGCVELPLAQSSMPVNLISLIGAGIEGIANVTGMSTTAFGGAVADVGDAIANTQRQISQKSAAGNAAQRQFESNAIIMCNYSDIVGTDYDNTGRPLCEKRLLGDMSGYVKTLNFKYMARTGTISEIRKIENYLNGGVYIE